MMKHLLCMWRKQIIHVLVSSSCVKAICPFNDAASPQIAPNSAFSGCLDSCGCSSHQIRIFCLLTYTLREKWSSSLKTIVRWKNGSSLNFPNNSSYKWRCGTSPGISSFSKCILYTEIADSFPYGLMVSAVRNITKVIVLSLYYTAS